MAIFQAASMILSAAANAAGLVWMELAMFGLAAVCYLAFIGIPAKKLAAKGGEKGTASLERGQAKVDDAGKTSPRDDRTVLASWERAKLSAEDASKLDIVATVHALRKFGKSPSEIIKELGDALATNPALLTVLAALPIALLRDDAVEMLDAVLELLEAHEHVADVSVYIGLMGAQLRRRNYCRVAATGARVPKDAMTPRGFAILASAAAQRGCLGEALGHVSQLPAPEVGAKSSLASLVAMQILVMAITEGDVTKTCEEFQRLKVQFEDKQFEEFVASHGRRLSPHILDELLKLWLSLGLSADVGPAVAAAKKTLARGAVSGNGDLQRCANLIKSHAKEHNLDAAFAVFDRFRSASTLVPMICNCLLDACVHCGDFERAFAHFEAMKRLQMVDTVGYNTLLKAHLILGRSVEARAVVKEMTDRGFVANNVTYNELLHAKVLAKDRVGMWAVVEEMLAANVQPNAVTCSIILKLCIGLGQTADLRRVVDLVGSIEEAVDEVLLSSVIEACIRLHQLDLLANLIKRFLQNGSGIRLSSPTYGSMMKAYGQAGDARRVLELWEEMQAQGVKPSSVTFGCLTEALVINGKAQEAWDLVRKQMVSEEMREHINTVIYSTVLKGFAVTKDVEKTFAVYDEMRSHNIACNTITFNTILDACAKSCAMTRASGLLQDMAKACVEPDIITYSTIIKGYCFEGDVDRAFHILEEMKSDGKYKPDEIMYNSILDGCAKQHRTEDALKVLDEMKASVIAPSNYTLSILVKVLGHARKLNQAFEMVESITKEHGFRPNVQVYTCLVQACINNRRLDRALSLHDEMIADVSCRVDDKFYAVLVRGCLQMRQPLKAVEVIRAAFRLPGTTSAAAQRGGRAVGVEPKTLQEVASKLQAGNREEQQAWARLQAELDQAGLKPNAGRDVLRNGVARSTVSGRVGGR